MLSQPVLSGSIARSMSAGSHPSEGAEQSVWMGYIPSEGADCP